MENSLSKYSITKDIEKWNNGIKRKKELYSRGNEIRNEFERDYTRIIHSTAYRRLKHKTQVFFSPENDHICTRIEHVTYVDSISYTIAKYLGLNLELTKSIAVAHDIGHSPFGHQGEKILSEISKKEIGESFWHEKNGVEIADKIELLEDNFENKQNMDLTYAVRDGIISHCGEIDENSLKPRKECINLDDYKYPNEYAPYTWEACVVKIADKISYLGRDIKDAISLGILDKGLNDLRKDLHLNNINNTILINDMIYDLCQNSNYNDGLKFSDEMFQKINYIKKYNYEKIYLSEKLILANNYFNAILNGLYNVLLLYFENKEKLKNVSMELFLDFDEWIKCYWNKERDVKCKNDVIFDVTSEKDCKKAIILFISGMTDNYAIQMYNNILKFL